MTAVIPGKFVWGELITLDPNKAVPFYTELLGWTINKVELGDGDYFMLWAGESAIGGVVALQPGQAESSFWVMYLTVTDVDKSVEKVLSLGGRVIQPARDLANVGRFSTVVDAQGAFFRLFTPVSPDGEPGEPQIGEFCWHELWTTDPEAANAFYKAIAGWTSQEIDMGGRTYHMQLRGERQAAGVMAIPAGAMPRPYWLPYVLVDDVDATSERVAGLGGAVLAPAMDIPNVGRFAIIGAPDQSVLAIFTGA